MVQLAAGLRWSVSYTIVIDGLSLAAAGSRVGMYVCYCFEKNMFACLLFVIFHFRLFASPIGLIAEVLRAPRPGILFYVFISIPNCNIIEIVYCEAA